MNNQNYISYKNGIVPVKAWVNGVQFEDSAKEQVDNMAQLPFIYKHIAIMPDVHMGYGATIGSVVATKKAIIPSAVGVDIGCGMMAIQTTLKAEQLPDNLKPIRSAIEKAIPHGKTAFDQTDKGAWVNEPDKNVLTKWNALETQFKIICEKHPTIKKSNHVNHLGTLGGGNHFVEVCLDEDDKVWIMLHSGSRGVGNRIGTYFIDKAKREMEKWFIHLPDKDLAYLPEGSTLFNDYIEAVSWAQDFAMNNRQIMMENAISAMHQLECLPEFNLSEMVVNCHHNYVELENHFGSNVYVTRKGAVRAREGDLGIIPGSMGAKSFIVKGKGNPDSFNSCSHGAGRTMSRKQAKKQFTVADQIKATQGVECRKDESVIDEIPMAYKSIDAVMNAQTDLVTILHTLKQVVCVKG